MKNFTRSATVAALVCAPFVALTPSAHAAPGDPSSSTSSASSTSLATPIEQALLLSWDDKNWSATTKETFVGTPVSVPGDTKSRTLSVRNTGPSGGTLIAKINMVDILDPNAPDVHHNTAHTDPDGPSGTLYKGAGEQGNFYDDLKLQWDMGGSTGEANFTTLDRNGDTQVFYRHVAQGETVPVKITYVFPIEATSGNKANVTKRLAKFDVQFMIVGDVPDATTPPPTAPPPTPTDPSSPPTTTEPPTSTNPPTSPEPSNPTSTQPGTPPATTPGAETPSPSTTKRTGINTGNDVDRNGMLLGLGVGGLLIGGGVAASRLARKKTSDADAPEDPQN